MVKYSFIVPTQELKIIEEDFVRFKIKNVGSANLTLENRKTLRKPNFASGICINAEVRAERHRIEGAKINK